MNTNSIKRRTKTGIIYVGPITIIIATLAPFPLEILSEISKQNNPTGIFCHPYIAMIKEAHSTILLAGSGYIVLFAAFINSKKHKCLSQVAKGFALGIPILAVLVIIESGTQQILFTILTIIVGVSLCANISNDDEPFGY